MSKKKTESEYIEISYIKSTQNDKGWRDIKKRLSFLDEALQILSGILLSPRCTITNEKRKQISNLLKKL